MTQNFKKMLYKDFKYFMKSKKFKQNNTNHIILNLSDYELDLLHSAVLSYIDSESDILLKSDILKLYDMTKQFTIILD